jgi:hypothetical protein
VYHGVIVKVEEGYSCFRTWKERLRGLSPTAREYMSMGVSYCVCTALTILGLGTMDKQNFSSQLLSDTVTAFSGKRHVARIATRTSPIALLCLVKRQSIKKADLFVSRPSDLQQAATRIITEVSRDNDRPAFPVDSVIRHSPPRSCHVCGSRLASLQLLVGYDRAAQHGQGL